MMAAIGKQLKQSVKVFHNFTLYLRLPEKTHIHKHVTSGRKQFLIYFSGMIRTAHLTKVVFSHIHVCLKNNHGSGNMYPAKVILIPHRLTMPTAKTRRVP